MYRNNAKHELSLRVLSQGVHMFPSKVLTPGDNNSESITHSKVYSTLLHFSAIIIQLKTNKCIIKLHFTDTVEIKLHIRVLPIWISH